MTTTNELREVVAQAAGLRGSVTAGGALMQTTEVENFPGFPGGVVDPDLRDHAAGEEGETSGPRREKGLPL